MRSLPSYLTFKTSIYIAISAHIYTHTVCIPYVHKVMHTFAHIIYNLRVVGCMRMYIMCVVGWCVQASTYPGSRQRISYIYIYSRVYVCTYNRYMRFLCLNLLLVLRLSCCCFGVFLKGSLHATRGRAKGRDIYII